MPAVCASNKELSSRSDGPNKKVVIGGALGGLYGLVFIILLGALLVRRRRKKREEIHRQEDIIRQEQMHQTSAYIGFDSYFDDLPRPTAPTPSQAQGILYSPSLSGSPSLSPERDRFSNDSQDTVLVRGSSDPFWMFNGAYGSIEGSLRTRSSSDSQISRTNRGTLPRSDSAPEIPVEAFVSHMNAQYSEELRYSKAVEVPLSFFRPQIREVVPSGSTQVPAGVYLSRGKPFLPPISIEPLIRKRSMDRIVSEIMELPMDQERGSPRRKSRIHKHKKSKSRKSMYSQRKSIELFSEKMMKKVKGEFAKE